MNSSDSWWPFLKEFAQQKLLLELPEGEINFPGHCRKQWNNKNSSLDQSNKLYMYFNTLKRLFKMFDKLSALMNRYNMSAKRCLDMPFPQKPFPGKTVQWFTVLPHWFLEISPILRQCSITHINTHASIKRSLTQIAYTAGQVYI